MRNRQEWKQRVQEEKENLKDYEVFESADYRTMLHSIAYEITDGTLKEVELAKEPNAPYGGSCSSLRVLLNIANQVTMSFPSLALRSDSIVGILGHECGHWNLSDLKLRKNYLDEMKQGRWMISLPLPEDWNGQEQVAEIHEFLTGDHPAAKHIMTETAAFIQNMIEDVYIEEIMCRRHPGSIRRGILQNRMRNMERVPSLKVQLKEGYRKVSVMLNLMVQYSLSGTVNNWEMETGVLLDLLEDAKPVIDSGIRCKDPLGRLKAADRLLLLIWKLLKTEIEEMEKNIKQEKQSSEKNESGQKEGDGKAAASSKVQQEDDGKDTTSSKVQKEVQEEWEKIKSELPDFLCPKEEADMDNTQSQVKGEQKETEIKPIETKEQLLRCIEKIAESKAEETHNAEILKELSLDLCRTEFNGDHRKVKMAVERKSRINQRDIVRYELLEPQIKQTVRKMKAVLLPAFCQQGERREKHLFFGTSINMQTLYDPFCRFYQKKESARTLNAAVAVLMDLSASMWGRRLEEAVCCCLCLYKFCISVGIPIMIYGHHTNGEGRSLQKELVTFHSLAEFEPDKNDCYRIATMDVTGSNRDGAALTYAGEKLAGRPERTKLLFCISDGRPNGALYCGEEAEADIRNIKKKLEANGIIVMAAAIGNDKETIERIYRDGYLDISDLDTLTVVLAREILKRIRR